MGARDEGSSSTRELRGSMVEQERTGIQWSRVTNEDKTREYYYD